MSKQISKFADTERYLIALNQPGPWTLTAIRPFSAFGGRKTETLYCTTIGQALAFLAMHNGKLNMHLTANTTKPVRDKPSAGDLLWLRVAQLDVDKDEHGVRLAPASKQTLIEKLLRGEGGIPGPPSFIIDSGNGIQAFWMFKTPLAATDENIHAVKEINAHLIAAFHGDVGTHNPVHLTRLPGTTNIPSASKLKEGLVECQTSLVSCEKHRYAVSSFDRKAVAAVSEGEVSSIGPAETIDSLDELDKWRVPDDVKRIVEHGIDPQAKDDLGKDDSRWQFKGVIGLLRRGVPDTIVKGLITDDQWGIARSTLKEGRNRTVDDYADRQIQQAHKAWRQERMDEFPDDITPEYLASLALAGQETDPSPRRREYSILEAMHWRDPKFQLDGIIPHNALILIYGAPKSFKTFVTLDIALHLAMGMAFNGQECTGRCVVTYVAAEGGRVC